MKRIEVLRAGTAAASVLIAAASATAGEEDLFPIFVVDPVTDQVYRGIDGDSDRAYLSPGEMVVFYDDTLGSIALDDPESLHTAPDDYVYIGDRTARRIIAMEDLDDDGDCHEPGEHNVHFAEATNLSGVAMAGVRSVHVRFLGETWVASANTLVSEDDAILFLKDLNADHDAEDASEARVYYVIAPGGAVADSIPTAVIQHPDGLVYYLENGSTGAIAKGVYALDDLNRNGVIDPPGEVFPYYLPAGAGMDLVSLDVDVHGVIYVGDDGQNRILRLEDADQNGVITPGIEDCVWYTSPVASASPDLTISNDGHELAALELVLPDRLLLMQDPDDDCFVDPFQDVTEAYNDVPGDISWSGARGVDWDFHGHADVGTAYCFGIKGRCPCDNDGSMSTGCRNSTGQGAVLAAEGTASVALDDLEFHAAQLPNGTTAILFQGDAAQNGGLGTHFFDGLLCVQAPERRLGFRIAAAHEATWGPGILAGPGEWAPGQTRYFQVWFRNIPGPCGNLSNTTNGVEITFER